MEKPLAIILFVSGAIGKKVEIITQFILWLVALGFFIFHVYMLEAFIILLRINLNKNKIRRGVYKTNNPSFLLIICFLVLLVLTSWFFYVFPFSLNLGAFSILAMFISIVFVGLCLKIPLNEIEQFHVKFNVGGLGAIIKIKNKRLEKLLFDYPFKFVRSFIIILVIIILVALVILGLGKLLG